MPAVAARRDMYFYGDRVDIALEGHLWTQQSTGIIRVFNGASWVTPGLASPTFTGTTTVTTLTVQSTMTSAGLKVLTQAAGAQGFVGLGSGAVPTAPTSTSGILQISALPGTPVGQSGVPTTGTVFITFDRISRAIAANIGGSWFVSPSMTMY